MGTHHFHAWRRRSPRLGFIPRALLMSFDKSRIRAGWRALIAFAPSIASGAFPRIFSRVFPHRLPRIFPHIFSRIFWGGSPGVFPGGRAHIFLGVFLGVFLAGCESLIYSTPPPHPAPAPSESSDHRDTARAVGPVQLRIAKGDTLYSISRRYRVSVAQLALVNAIKAPYILRIGQIITVPAPRFHKVRANDTISTLARRYRVSQSAIVKLNRLDKNGWIRIGETLRIPASPPWPGPGGMDTAGANAPTSIKKPQKRVRTPAKVQPGKIPKGGFSWPLRGRLLATFGQQKNGLHNDGINIHAPLGTPVRAIKDGKVVYIGDALVGMGNLLLIRHDRGWTSAYAHISAIHVQNGEKVKSGQIIARVGKSGRVKRPQLHFQLRRRSDPVDPRRHLPPLSS